MLMPTRPFAPGFRAASIAFGMTSVLLGILVFMGFALNVKGLTSLSPFIVSMNPAGTMTFILAGISLILLNETKKRSAFNRLGAALAAIVGFVGFVKIVGLIAVHEVYFDSILFSSQINEVANGHLNRITPNAAIVFFCVGVSLAMSYGGKRIKTSNVFACLGIITAMLALFGYIYNVEELVSVNGLTPIALNAMLGLLLLSLGALFALPEQGLMRYVTDDGAAGVAARRLMLVALITPEFLDVVFHNYPTQLRLVLISLGSSLVFASILWSTITKLHAVDMDRAAAVGKLQEEGAKDRALMESIGDGVFAVDRTWHITFWNRAAEHISGMTQEEVVGRQLNDVLKFERMEDGTENISFIEEAMRKGTSQTMGSHTQLIAKDGRKVPLEDSAAPIIDQKTGLTTGAVIVFRDVSNEYELEAHKQQLSRMRDDFVFRTIHDLSSPVNVIRMALAVHAEEDKNMKKTAKELESISVLKEVSERMSKLIEDLCRVAAGENPDVLLKKTTIDTEPLLKELLQALAPTMTPRNIVMKYEIQTKSRRVIADPDALGEVFDNLLTNAIKYSKDGGTITVSQETAGAFLNTSFQDAGIGISVVDQSKLFMPYFRAVGQEIPGTGLGLYIVKTLVEKMGGTIAVSSTLGQGTRFTVSLPAAR